MNATASPLPAALTRWHCLPLSPDVTVATACTRPTLPPATEARVEAIWQRAVRERPALFNGRVFCTDRVTPDRIEGHWTEYRRALAQLREPGIFAQRPLHQLAVCGALYCPDGLVLARRAPFSLYLGGFWQSPPAGTVEARTGQDTVNLPEQLRAEAQEELGLIGTDLEVGAPLVAVTHPDTHVVDIGLCLRTPLTFPEIITRWKENANREYDRLMVLTPRQMRDPAAWPQVLPTTLRLVEAMWKSPPRGM